MSLSLADSCLCSVGTLDFASVTVTFAFCVIFKVAHTKYHDAFPQRLLFSRCLVVLQLAFSLQSIENRFVSMG